MTFASACPFSVRTYSIREGRRETMVRDFKNLQFGVNIHTGIQPGVDPVTEALHAEQLGFDVVTLHGDVLHGNDPSFELPPRQKGGACL
jgi:hypothetical protein